MPTSLSGWPPIAPPVQPARGLFGIHRLAPGELRDRRHDAGQVLLVERAEGTLAVRQHADLDRRSVAGRRRDGLLRRGQATQRQRRRRARAALLELLAADVLDRARAAGTAAELDLLEPQPAATRATTPTSRASQYRPLLCALTVDMLSSSSSPCSPAMQAAHWLNDIALRPAWLRLRELFAGPVLLGLGDGAPRPHRRSPCSHRPINPFGDTTTMTRNTIPINVLKRGPMKPMLSA